MDQESVNILLVDDQPAKLLAYEVILKDLGEQLIVATSGREALEVLLKTEIAVILIDVCMPELDGFELASMIREHPRFQRTAIIFISAIQVSDIDRLRGYEMGAVDYVPVPVVPEVLRAKIKVFAELNRKTRQLERLNAELEDRVRARTAELERSTARLEESEQRRSMALAAGRMGSWDWDWVNGNWSWDEGQYQIFGVDPRQFEVTPEHVKALLHPDDVDKLHKLISEFANSAQTHETELRIGRPNGEQCWCFITAAATSDKNGRVVRVSGVTIDITERKQAEARVAADLRDMMLLNQLNNSLARAGNNLDRNLNAAIDTATAIAGAQKANLQLLDPTTGALTIAAQRGFKDSFLNFFASVGDDISACAAAIRSGERVIVEDVRESEIFVGPSKQALLDAGVRAVTSMPLMASTGSLLGVISTHFAGPHRPSERELHLMNLLARQVADYLERKRADENEATLAREIQHRSNNLLSVIQTIATRSLSGSHTLAEARQAFEARLQALARSNRQLTKSNWSGVNLSEIVRLEMQPYAEHTKVNGIDVWLNPQHAQNFSLTLHELATNAAKYGALSNGSGIVGVSWTIGKGQSNNNNLKFKWQESGGPPVAAPTRQGFGTTLIKAAFPDARLDYSVEGLSCEIAISLGQSQRDQTGLTLRSQSN